MPTSTWMLAIADRIPNDDAIALSPTIGWLLLLCATAFAASIIIQSDRWRRLWLRSEDPRSLGLFRIVFAVFTLFNINGLWEHFRFLFTDEGIFPTDVARQVLAGKQLAGFGDGFGGDPYGFFDFRAWLQFLEGPKYSILFFWDSPTAFWTHLIAFEVVTILFALGLWSRLTGIASFLLMNSIMVRNPLFWEGTDLVYRVFFFYLILAKSGHAYSLDNWLRCRKLRKLGALSEPGGPGEGAGIDPDEHHPRGLAAIYRRIPAWPRMLMMLQVATIYLYGGFAKNGAVWWRGDSLYYALNMDHFYRFPPQAMSALFGTNMFRLMTWTVKFWQMGFVLVIVGLVLRWMVRDKLPPLHGWRKQVFHVCTLTVALGALAIVEVAYPVHHAAGPGRPDLLTMQVVVAVAWLIAIVVIAAGYRRLRQRPFRVRWHGRVRTLDLEWFCSWFLGRRLWLTLGVFFHLHIFVLMNIGMFAPIMMMVYLCFLNGEEVALVLRDFRRALSWLRIPFFAPALHDSVHQRPIAAESSSLAHLPHDGFVLPQSAMLATLAAAVGAIVLEAYGRPEGRYLAIGGGLFLLVTSVRTSRKLARGEGVAPGRPVAWAYGPLGRLIANVVVIFHILAVASTSIPDKDCTVSFRERVRRPFSRWLLTTQTNQGWNMFAPNPPRANVFLQVLVTGDGGETWDMNTDVYAPGRKPIPWIWNDRQFKMNRRVSGGESGDGEWYRKWLARWYCREWAHAHGGQPPEKVELVKISYRIPTPEDVRERGWYRPDELLARTAHRQSIYTERCATAPEGQLSNRVRERYGMDPAPEGDHRRWIKHKLEAWKRQR